MPTRVFTPLELNHLRRHGYSNADLTNIKDTPVEYFTGHAEFRGLDLLVNKSTLIPRLESEKIVDIANQFISTHNLTHPDIADIGTGSGCLAVSLAFNLQQKQIPYTIYLSDISEEALKTAQANASKNLTSTANLFFEQSDLFENYPHIKFDIIMANLPYVPSANIPNLDSSVKNYEPHTALDGGTKGVTIINRLLSVLPTFLDNPGMAILEIDDTHKIEDFVIPSGFSTKIERDTFNIPRFLIVGSKP